MPKIHHSSWIVFLIGFVLTVLTLSAPASVQTQTVYDLAADWSDTSNPNGPWSYNDGPGHPIPVHLNDWDPDMCCFVSPQPAWVLVPQPQQGHVPVWLKVVSPNFSPQADLPIGRVVMHGTSGISSVVSTPAGVSWTSPLQGVMQITGGVWLVNKSSGRGMAWTLYVNGIPITSGNLTPADPFTSQNPLTFANGSGGPSVLTRAVSVGDVINLEIVKTSSFADFVGVDMTITVGTASPVMITTAALPPYPLREFTAHQLEAMYGIPPYTWSVVKGNLPNGLQLRAHGLLEGTPTEAGVFPITVQVADQMQGIDEATFDIVVDVKTVWDLAADWSDLRNPNGPWSYNSPSATLITTHWDDWDPQHCCFTFPQPAWADAQWPGFAHEALWFKTVSPTLSTDLPIGTVGTHGFAIPGGASVTWTSPTTGFVTISGGTWLAAKIGRSMDWNLSINGTLLTQGSLTSSDAFTSTAPFNFAKGSGGEAVLTRFVSVGDVIRLEYGPPSGLATFVGVNLTITSIPPQSLRITPEKLSAVKVGEPFSQQLEVTFGEPPFSWVVVNGNLPADTSLTPEGLLSGMPTEIGDFPFTVMVTDNNGEFAEKEFTLKVLVTLPPPDIRLYKTSTVTVPGRTVDYFISAENVGIVRANFLLLEVLLPPEFFVLETVSPAPQILSNVLITWLIKDLQPGAVETLQYRVRLDPTLPRGITVPGGILPILIKKLGDEITNELVTGLTKDEWLKLSAFLSTLPCVNRPLLTAVNAPTSCPDMIGACATRDAVHCGQFAATCAFALNEATRDCDACNLYPGTWTVHCKETVAPVDPNEKLVVAKRFIQPNQLLVYPIHFENIGNIEALDVFVTDVLAPNLDASTLDILTPNGSFNSATRTLQWNLLGINLEPNATGNVLFSIRPLPNLPSGTEIRNRANIQFEVFEIITTNEVVNVIDSTPPHCTMNALPPETFTSDVTILWSGTDAIGEIDTFTVFVSVDGGSFTPFLEKTRDTQAIFHGQVGKTYAFLCVATDTAGNIEVQAPVAEATTTLVLSDTTPPVITVSATPATLWPPNGKMVPVTIVGTMTDSGSGVNASTATYAVTDEYGSVQPRGSVALKSNGSYSFTISLQASRNGNDKDGRQYTITVGAQDNAENKGSASAFVTVPHDQGK